MSIDCLEGVIRGPRPIIRIVVAVVPLVRNGPRFQSGHGTLSLGARRHRAHRQAEHHNEPHTHVCSLLLGGAGIRHFAALLKRKKRTASGS
jgi:hypothetical protein